MRPAPRLTRLILRLAAPAHRVLVPVGAPILSRLPLFQASSLLWPGSAVEDGPSAWALHPMGDQEKHLAPAIGTARCAGRSALPRRPLEGEPTAKKEDLSLCLSLTVHSACQKKKIPSKFIINDLIHNHVLSHYMIIHIYVQYSNFL